MNNKNLTKEHIAINLSKKTGYSVNYSKKLINDFIDILINNIKNKKSNLKNLGAFKLINKKERIGRNPKTKEKFIISSRKSISFITSKKIVNVLNLVK